MQTQTETQTQAQEQPVASPPERLLPDRIEFEEVLVAGGVLAAAVLAAIVVHFVLFRVLKRVSKGPGPLPEEAVDGLRRPTLLLLIIGGIHVASPALDSVIGTPAVVLRHALSIGMIAASAWLALRAMDAVTHAFLHRFDTSVTDNLQARRVHTQTVVLRRAVKVVLVILATGAVLMTFPSARQIGASVLASAGIAGLAVGLAARSVVENLLAGLQIAITQPIRLDDVVIIDGEWGRIEDITATFVVVSIWDQRRLIVPLSRIITQPFENWTRQTSQLIGTVFVFTDYSVDVPRVREWLMAYLRTNPKWDGRVAALQVTDTTERTIQIRALVSARNSGETFDLRCETREALVAFINKEFPGSLPQVRSTNIGPDGGVLEAGTADDDAE